MTAAGAAAETRAAGAAAETRAAGAAAETRAAGAAADTRAAAATTRRGALAAAALAALTAPAIARAQRSDIAVLIKLVEREEAAAKAYGAGAGELLPRLYNDELDHAAALRTHLDALGRRPAPRGLDAPARRVAEASADDRLDAAVALESSLVEEYAAALPDIADPSVLQTAATILASHAQHLARMLALTRQ